MNKYILVIKNTWNEIITYRLNFLMWRVRTIIQLLTIYFLWTSVMPIEGQIFGYTRNLMLTYIILTNFVNSIIVSTRTQEIAENINNGDLSVFLIKPFNYFKYWLFRDFGDKLMNIFLSAIEILIIFLILKPPIYLQNKIDILLFTLLSIILGLILNFLIGCLLSMLGFWTPEVWAPRFLYYVLLTFFAGIFFPLDILPKALFHVLQGLPFAYLIFFPIKIYLGQLNLSQILSGFSIALIWILIFYFLLKIIWQRGLKIYGAYGR